MEGTVGVLFFFLIVGFLCYLVHLDRRARTDEKLDTRKQQWTTLHRSMWEILNGRLASSRPGTHEWVAHFIQGARRRFEEYLFDPKKDPANQPLTAFEKIQPSDLLHVYGTLFIRHLEALSDDYSSIDFHSMVLDLGVNILGEKEETCQQWLAIFNEGSPFARVSFCHDQLAGLFGLTQKSTVFAALWESAAVEGARSATDAAQLSTCLRKGQQILAA